MKVEIRKPKLSDANGIRELIDDKKIIKQLFGYPYPCPLSRAEKDIQNSLKGWRTGKSYGFTILADGQIAGSIILENPSKDKGRYDIGFFVGRRFWNKGVATEAIKEIVKFGFKKLKVYRIQGDNDSDNPSSGRAMKKAGFTFEGVRRKIRKKNGRYVDLNLWGITR